MSRFILGGVGIALAALFWLSGAHAATVMDSGSNKTIFFDKGGKRLTPLEANRKGESGEEVLACKTQDYVCNERTGKCALKNSR